MRERWEPAGWGTILILCGIVLAGWMGSATVSTATSSPASSQVVSDACADADGDGRLTVGDGVQALRVVAELPNSCSPFRCDVDGSGATTLRDGILILRRAAGLFTDQAFRCPVPRSVRDFSDFTAFSLTRQSGLGFCPELGSVLDAEIVRQGDGAYLARLWVAEEGPFDPDSCEFPFGEPTCIRRVPVPERVLTDDELEVLREAFRSVVVYAARDPSCAVVAYDYCLLDHFVWDGVAVSGDICAGRRTSYGDVQRMQEALDRLLPPAGAP